MILAFILTMPTAASWNGRWSGEKFLHARVKNIGTSKKAVEKGNGLIGHHRYAWDDGWVADVEVRQVDAAEARRLRRDSRGFAGYDWMVDDLMLHGEIKQR